MTEEAIVPTPDQLRGITHPVRIKLLGLLRMDGPQTSADLARATGLNTGATSYHLRQLAQHGFIEDAPDLGSGRERFWRARHRSTRPLGSPRGPGETASLDVQAAWQQTVITWTTGIVQSAQDEWSELPEPWRDATTFTDYLYRLNPEQASTVLQRLVATLEEVSREFPYDPDAGTHPADGSSEGDDAELWEVHLLAFPVPGRIPHRGDR